MLWLLSVLVTFIYVNKGAYDIIVDLNNDQYVTVAYPTPSEFNADLLDNAYLLVNSDDDTARLVITGTFEGDAVTRPVTGWMLPDEEKLTSELFGNGTGFDAEIAIGTYLRFILCVTSFTFAKSTDNYLHIGSIM